VALAEQLRGISAVSVVEKDFEFEAVLERKDADWIVSLQKPNGTIALKRSLTGACADVSFAAALIIERFVRALDVKVPGGEKAAAKAAETKSAESKTAAAKVAESKTAAAKVTETKAAETKASETKASETKASETKAAETKAAETKAAETKAAETRAAETRAAETRAAETRAAETRAAETKAAETKAAETKAAETKAAETKAAETKAAETKAAETKAAETKTAEAKAAETKAAETKAAETKAAKTKAAEQKAADVKAAEEKAAAEAASAQAQAAEFARKTAELNREVLLPPRPFITRFEISAGGVAWVDSNPGINLRAGVDGEISVFIRSTFRLSAQFIATGPEESLIFDEGFRGGIYVQPFIAMLGAEICARLRTDSLRGCGGLIGGAHFAHAFTTEAKNLPVRQDGWLAAPTFGLEAQLGWLPLRHLVFSLALAGLINPAQPRFTVSGIDSATKSFPLIEGLLRLSVGFGSDT
jgi:hypothetical protein